MNFRHCAAVALLLASPLPAAEEPAPAKHVVVVVWDGMRPDFVNDHNTPTLAALARDGVVFKNNHSAYPSSTNVNGAVLATGMPPNRTGIVANQEFRPEIDPLKPFDTADFPALNAPDAGISAKFLVVPTLAEIVQRAGFPTAVAGSKPVAQLFDRARQRESDAAKNSIVVYRGKALPASAEAEITSALGPFPTEKAFPKTSENNWTTRALTEVLWKDEVPKFSLLWLSDPDLTEHHTAPGSPAALAAIKGSDDNLAKVLAALKTKNALTNTDIIVVSDHGFSTVDRLVDVAARLQAAGFHAVRAWSAQPPAGRILVVTLGGSVGFYVAGHDAAVISRLIDFLQSSDFAGVILTRDAHPGTFTLAQAQLDTPTAPDLLVALSWNGRPNEFGASGGMTSDIGRQTGQGSHSTMSPHDMHNLLVASGPDFRHGWTNETPSGNIDVAPTVLELLGIKPPQRMSGRVLREALRNPDKSPAADEQDIIAQRKLGDRIWRQHLRTMTVSGVTYFLEGDGGSTPQL